VDLSGTGRLVAYPGEVVKNRFLRRARLLKFTAIYTSRLVVYTCGPFLMSGIGRPDQREDKDNVYVQVMYDKHPRTSVVAKRQDPHQIFH
jgi:hypothetical protein